jgi:putative MFS transporter
MNTSPGAAQPLSDTDTRIVARLDRLPVTRMQVFWVIVLGLAYFVETFDNSVFAYAAPTIRSEWGLPLESIGVITSAVFAGMMIGAIVGGRISDRFGRKRLLVWSSVLYSLGSLMSALAPNYEILAVSRVVTGIGVQAATGVIMVYLAEMFPRLSRGRFFSALTFIGLTAGPVTSLLALRLATEGDPGSWRWLFVLGAAGLLVAILAATALPESVRWLQSVGRHAAADRIVSNLESRAVAYTRRPLADPVVVPELVTPKGTYRELLSPVYLKRIGVGTAGWFLFLFVVYGHLSWVATVLVETGMSQTEALGFVSVLSISSFVSPVLLFPVADRLNRRTTIMIACLVAAASFAVFSFALSPTVMVVFAFIGQTMLAVGSAAFYTYIPEILPTHVRGIGAGFINGVGRVGGVLQGLVIAGIFAVIGFQGLYLVLAAIVVLVGLIIGVLGERTAKRALEEISGE